MSDTLNKDELFDKVYQRLHSMWMREYNTVDEADTDIQELLYFIEDTAENLDTLGLHVKGDDGVWRKVRKN